MNTRRDFLAKAAALCGAIVTSAAAAVGSGKNQDAAQAGKSRNFVLVHGAFHGGWCYQRVAEILRAKGHRVYTPTLTGLGERSHLARFPINCSTHIQDIINVIHWENLTEVILCGHSYGGMVIGGVSDAISPVISAVVYLDCKIPENGKSAFDLYPNSREPFVAATRENGGFLIKPLPAKSFKVNAADQEMVDALLTPHPLATLSEALKLTGAYVQIARKVYVRATNFGVPVPEQVRENPEWKVFEIPSGHDMMLDAPAALSEVLLSIV